MTSQGNEDGKTWKDLLWENVSDYCYNTTLHGYKYLTEPGRHWIERLLWFLVNIAGGCATVLVIFSMWQKYVDTPTFTTVESTSYPVWNVRFPAVAVCNINRISRSAAKLKAEKLSKTLGIPSQRLYDMMRYLGRLYDFDGDDGEKVLELHNLLTLNNNTYNVTELMKELTPNCSQLLLKCMWKGHMEECSKWFTERKTMDGYCCTFNYIRKTETFDVSSNYLIKTDNDVDHQALRVSTAGLQMGLKVLVNPVIEDYYYPLISTQGVKVLVFNPRDFADTASGGLIEKLIPPNEEIFLRLSATSVYATPAVRHFAHSDRRCLFSNEMLDEFGGDYSFSDCLLSCRVKSMLTLCQCVPFFLPSVGDSRACDLRDVSCLNKYREKWLTLRPNEEGEEDLDLEYEDSLSCSQCLPACWDTSYDIQLSSGTLGERRYDTSAFLHGIESLKGLSVFHLYFGTSDSLRLKQDVLYTWYDLLSSFGGICGLFLGFSFASVAEFVYFFTIRYYFLLKDRGDVTLREQGENITHSQVAGRDIYWREIATLPTIEETRNTDRVQW